MKWQNIPLSSRKIITIMQNNHQRVKNMGMSQLPTPQMTIKIMIIQLEKIMDMNTQNSLPKKKRTSQLR